MSGRQGFQDYNSGASEFNAVSFVVSQLIGRVGTATAVRVVAVTNAGGVTPVGFVDVLPLVNQVDGAGNATPHGTIHGLPYSRLQGGANAVILDPQVGDIGVAVFASRDISSVKANRAQANPGSRRRFDMADGMYVGAILNAAPTQYVRFSTLGVEIVSPTRVTITAPNIDTTGVLTNNGHAIGSTHLHTGVQGGGGTSGPPV
jgi:hypothetical protein